MLPDAAPGREKLAHRLFSIGAGFLLGFGPIGLLTDSPLAGTMADAGLMMMVVGMVLKRQR